MDKRIGGNKMDEEKYIVSVKELLDKIIRELDRLNREELK